VRKGKPVSWSPQEWTTYGAIGAGDIPGADEPGGGHGGRRPFWRVGVAASALARGLELEHCPDDLLILRLLTELPRLHAAGPTGRGLLFRATRTAIPVLRDQHQRLTQHG